MDQPRPPEEPAPALSARARIAALIAGFMLLGAATLLLLYGANLLSRFSAQDASALPQVESLAVGTPRVVASPVSVAPAPSPGEPAPDFLLSDLQGEDVSLAQFHGQPVIVNFWATWCAPCILEMPELQAAYEAHGDSGLVVLGVNYDESKPVIGDFLANDLEAEITFPILLDEHADIADSYGVMNLPTTYFVDADGAVSAVHRGPLTQEQIDEFLAGTS